MRTLLLLTVAACSPAPYEDSPTPPPGFDPAPWRSGSPSRPFPQPVATAAGQRPSMPDAALTADLKAAYDAWLSRYVVWTRPGYDGAPRLRVRVDTHARADTVSEGQGYGMLMTAWFAGHDPQAQVRFDGLWRYATDHRSEADGRLMDWHVPWDGRAEPGGDDAAFDGDADIAYALLLADAQWGSTGLIDYRREAIQVMAGLADSALGPSSALPMLGDWVDPNGQTYNERTTRSSDWMPAHFRAFAFASGDGRWGRAVDAVHAAAQQAQTTWAPNTGLLPDFLVPDGATKLQPAPAGFLEGPHDGHWSYNAVRAPWRLGADAIYVGDPRAIAEVTAMSKWARASTGGQPARLASTYLLDGTAADGYRWSSSLFQAGVMVATAVDPDGQPWLNAAWTSVARAREGYFEDTVSLLCLLTVSGRAWTP